MRSTSCCALQASVVIEDGEVADDLVQDVLEILTLAYMDIGRQSEVGGWRQWDAGDTSVPL